MKNYLLPISIAGLLMFGACDNKRGTENSQYDTEADTSAIAEGFNSRGVPQEGIPDNNAMRGDTLEIETDTRMGEEDLPPKIMSEIQADETLAGKELTDSRKFTERGVTYYELTFDRQEDSKVIFDEQGNRVPGQNDL